MPAWRIDPPSQPTICPVARPAATNRQLESEQWAKFLKQTVESIRDVLGIQGKIAAIPYKFLIYGKGGRFKAHKDTEKLDAMFGTLVIALPSKHEGGKLHIRHDGREITVDFSMEAHRNDLQYAAFFADCEHEVVPVVSGYRCCLVYNLRLVKGDPAMLNLPVTAQSRLLLPALASLKKERAGRLSAILLEHSYTKANLSLRNLKGNGSGPRPGAACRCPNRRIHRSPGADHLSPDGPAG